MMIASKVLLKDIDNVRLLREKYDMTNKQIAEIYGFSSRTISRFCEDNKIRKCLKRIKKPVAEIAVNKNNLLSRAWK